MSQKIWWAEDFTPGLTFSTPGATISEAQILDFALKYDPQPFHLDKTAGEASIYGGLIASGFQTMSVAFRLWQSMAVINPSSQGAPGMEEVLWRRPVRPGDTIHCIVKVVSNRRSTSRPELHVVGWDWEVFNQADEKVMSWKGVGFYLRAPDRRGS